MNSLVSLVFDITEIERQIVQCDGELTPELEAQFDLTTGDIRSKIDAYKIVSDAFQARAEYFKDSAEQLTHARRLFENQKNRLKENVKFAMKNLNVTELEGNDWRYKLSRGKPALQIDESLLPDGFFKTVETKVVDRVAIEEALALGMTIPGVSMQESESLRVYVNAAGKSREVKEIKE